MYRLVVGCQWWRLAFWLAHLLGTDIEDLVVSRKEELLQKNTHYLISHERGKTLARDVLKDLCGRSQIVSKIQTLGSSRGHWGLIH